MWLLLSPHPSSTVMAPSIDVDPCLAAAEVENELDLLSGTITAAFSLQIRAELVLVLLPPPSISWICLFFPAYLQPGSGLGPGGLCSACQSLMWLYGALGLLWACAAMVALCGKGLPSLWSFAGRLGLALGACSGGCRDGMPQNHLWCWC